MDADFEPRRSDMLDAVIVTVCVALLVGSIGLAAVVAWGDLKGRVRWWRIGR